MEAKTKSWVILPFFLLVAIFMQQCVHGESQVPCLFVVGCPTMEITTTTKSNYKSYGIDFPTSPTRRFTNGQMPIDLIGKISFGLQNIFFFIKIRQLYSLRYYYILHMW